MANEDSNNPFRQNTNMFHWSITNDEQDSRRADSIDQAAEHFRRMRAIEGLSNENVSSLHRPILPSLQGPEHESAYRRPEQLPESATASPFGSLTQSGSSSLWLPQAQSRTSGQQSSTSLQQQLLDLLTQRASVYSSSLPQYQTRSLAVSSPFGSNFLFDPRQPSSAAPGLRGPEHESAYRRHAQLPESATASPFGSVTQSVSSSLWLPQAQSRTSGQQSSTSFQRQLLDLLTQRASVNSSSLPQYQTRSLAVSRPFPSNNYYHHGQPNSTAPGEAYRDSSRRLEVPLSSPHRMRRDAPPFIPSRLQPNYSSIPANSPQGVSMPPMNLSQGHQPISEAELVNNARTAAMSDLKLVVEHIEKPDAENNSPKTWVYGLIEITSRAILQIAKLKYETQDKDLAVAGRVMSYLSYRLEEVENQFRLPGSSSKGKLSQGMETGCSAYQNTNPVKMELEDLLPTREHPSPFSFPGRRPGTEPLLETREHPFPLPSPGRRPGTLQETRELPSPPSYPGRRPGKEQMHKAHEDPSCFEVQFGSWEHKQHVHVTCNCPLPGRKPGAESVQENFQGNDQAEAESAISSSAIEASDSTAPVLLGDQAEFPEIQSLIKNPKTKAERRREQYGGNKG